MSLQITNCLKTLQSNLTSKPSPPLSLPHHLNFKYLFYKNPIMSSPNPSSFSTPQSLFQWLKPRLPVDSFATWGVTPGTKNVHNLWLELYQGETSLTDSTPPLRIVQVLSVRIRDTHDRILLESHQELTDGSIRERVRPLSEKLKPNESIEDGVVRAVKEELGVSSDVKIVPGSYIKKVEERVSLSYPGLPASYVLHCVDALVDGLPEGVFCTEEEEYGEGSDCTEAEVSKKAVKVKKHFWKWVGSEIGSA